MSKKKTIYLAGPIMNVSDLESSEWRSLASEILSADFRILNPLRRNTSKIPPRSAAEVVVLDKNDILDSEIVLVNLDPISVGTSMEILYAYTNHKYIVSFSKKVKEELSPWTIFHSTRLEHSLEDAISYILENLK